MIQEKNRNPKEACPVDRENPAKPYMPPNPFGVNQVYYERIQNMRLLDDALMTAALADNIPATQLILRIILGKDDLVITSVRAQSEYKNLRGHSLRLDVDAVDSEGRKYDIEIQRDNREAKPERGRYHMAIIDGHHRFRQSGGKPLVYGFAHCVCTLYHRERLLQKRNADLPCQPNG